MADDFKELDDIVGMDETIAKDGTLLVEPAKKSRARRVTVGGMVVPFHQEKHVTADEADPEIADEIQQLLDDKLAGRTPPTMPTLAHDGKSDAGHTNEDKPTTGGEESQSW